MTAKDTALSGQSEMFNVSLNSMVIREILTVTEIVVPTLRVLISHDSVPPELFAGVFGENVLQWGKHLHKIWSY